MTEQHNDPSSIVKELGEVAAAAGAAIAALWAMLRGHRKAVLSADEEDAKAMIAEYERERGVLIAELGRERAANLELRKQLHEEQAKRGPQP